MAAIEYLLEFSLKLAILRRNDSRSLCRPCSSFYKLEDRLALSGSIGVLLLAVELPSLRLPVPLPHRRLPSGSSAASKVRRV
jgi:hypothetical protein